MNEKAIYDCLLSYFLLLLMWLLEEPLQRKQMASAVSVLSRRREWARPSFAAVAVVLGNARAAQFKLHHAVNCF